MRRTYRLKTRRTARAVRIAAGLILCLAFVAADGPAVDAPGNANDAAGNANHAAGDADRPPEFSRAVLIRMEGTIGPILQHYIFRSLDRAKQSGADLVILEIDSPGGYLAESLEIAERLRNLKQEEGMTAVAYVPREAISGAAIAALGCDEILMRPDALIGDAGPIIQGEDSLFRHAPEKIRDYLVQRMRALAEAKGRPPAVAESMANLECEVFAVRDRKTDETTFMSEQELADAPPDKWEKGKLVAESAEGKFLTVPGRRAVELQLAEGLAKDRDALRRRFGIDGDLTVLEPTAVDTAVFILNLRLVTGVLLLVGLVALYIELAAPGIGLGGLTAGLCFAVFFWSRFLGGTAAWLEVVLFAGGVVFLMVELFVLPGFGIAGISGLLMLLASILLAGQGSALPATPRELTALTHSLLTILLSGVAASVAVFFLSKHFGRLPVFGRLMLQPPDAAEPAAGSLAAGERASGEGDSRFRVEIDDVGIADSPLRPAGRVRFGDEYVDVVTEGAFVPEGTRVRVLKINGNRVVVRAVDKPS